MKLAIIQWDEICFKRFGKPTSINSSIKNKNILMLTTRSERIPEEIKKLKINYQYFYLEKRGYILNKQQLVLEFAENLERAIEVVSKKENIEERNVFILGSREKIENSRYHIYDVKSETYSIGEEIENFVKRINYQ